MSPFRNTLICKFVLCYLFTIGQAVEPQCSKFPYEEALLEKMVRTEFNVEKMVEEIKAVKASVLDEFAKLGKHHGELEQQTEFKVEQMVETNKANEAKVLSELAKLNQQRKELTKSVMDNLQQSEAKVSRMSMDLKTLENVTEFKVEQMAENNKANEAKVLSELEKLNQQREELEQQTKSNADKFKELTKSVMDNLQQSEAKVSRMSMDLKTWENVTEFKVEQMAENNKANEANVLRELEKLNQQREELEQQTKSNADKFKELTKSVMDNLQQSEAKVSRMSMDLKTVENATEFKVEQMAENNKANEAKVLSELEKLNQQREELEQQTKSNAEKFKELTKSVMDNLQQSEAKVSRMSMDLKTWENGTLHQLKAELTTSPVLFRARNVLDESPSKNTVFVFSIIMEDVGGGYNKGSGVFTAPIGGVYLFTVQLCSYGNTAIFIAFVKDDVSIQLCKLQGHGYSCGMSSLVTRLEAGSRVWIKSTANHSDQRLYSGSIRQNVFTGILIN